MILFDNGIYKQEIKFLTSDLVEIREEIAACDYAAENEVIYTTFKCVGIEVVGSKLKLKLENKETTTEVLLDLITLVK